MPAVAPSFCGGWVVGKWWVRVVRGKLFRVLGDVGPDLVFHQVADSGSPRLNFRENNVDRITRTVRQRLGLTRADMVARGALEYLQRLPPDVSAPGLEASQHMSCYN